MARLPTVGGDDNNWGSLLNDYLSVAHNADGTLKVTPAADSAVVHNTGAESVAGVKAFSSSPTVPTPSGSTDVANKAYVDLVGSTGTPDADGSTKGKLQLTNDLGGTAAAPTVVATHLSAALPLAQGGTGSTTKNFVDLTTAQSVAGVKTFSSAPVVPSNSFPESAVTSLTTDLSARELTANKAQANGYASLDGTTKVPIAQVPTGSTGSTVALGNHTHTLTFSLSAFSKVGALTVVAGTQRLPIDGTYTIVGVRLMVGTAPTGADLIIDVNKNGTTIFSTQGNRPRITASSNSGGPGSTPDTTALVAGDYLTIDIDQIGSTIAGSDLTVSVIVTKTV